MTARVVVIVRTKDRPRFLERALHSVAAQSAPGIVPVVVNDGGDTEAVDEVIARSKVAASTLVVHHSQSLGRSAALNAGLAVTTSDFFAIHDDDDTWDPDFLSSTVTWLVEHVGHLGVAARTEVVFEQLQADGTCVETGREILAADTREVTLLQTAWQNYVPPIAMLVRTAVVTHIGAFDPELPVLEDWDFNLRLLARGPMGFLPDRPLAFWHQRPDAEGPSGNSVVAEAAAHEFYDQQIRDAYLRRDVLKDGGGLGVYLATARVLRQMGQDSDLRWAEHVSVLEEGDRAHAEHLSTVSLTLGLEVSRLRGELLALRETVQHLELTLTTTIAALRSQLRSDAKPIRQGLRRMSRRVDDLWQTDKGVARLVRERDAGRRRRTSPAGGRRTADDVEP